MRFLLNQQVWEWQIGGAVGWACPDSEKALTLVPASQICPVLYHSGMVLLNSLLDTVPGKLMLMGPGALGQT
jgi:hypothetical protein